MIKIEYNAFLNNILTYNSNRVVLRASTAGVVNVPNAKYLAHLPHQTQK